MIFKWAIAAANSHANTAWCILVEKKRDPQLWKYTNGYCNKIAPGQSFILQTVSTALKNIGEYVFSKETTYFHKENTVKSFR